MHAGPVIIKTVVVGMGPNGPWWHSGCLSSYKFIRVSLYRNDNSLKAFRRACQTLPGTCGMEGRGLSVVCRRSDLWEFGTDQPSDAARELARRINANLGYS